jgi:hypothetical protein
MGVKVGLCPTFTPPNPFFVGTHIQEQGKCDCPGPMRDDRKSLRTTVFIRLKIELGSYIKDATTHWTVSTAKKGEISDVNLHQPFLLQGSPTEPFIRPNRLHHPAWQAFSPEWGGYLLPAIP